RPDRDAGAGRGCHRRRGAGGRLRAAPGAAGGLDEAAGGSRPGLRPARPQAPRRFRSGFDSSGFGGRGVNRIGAERLTAEAPLQEVTGTDCGAVVSFVGTVRSTNHGKVVVRLEYEAYPDMALRVFDRICSEAKECWGARVVIHHRTGSL